MFCYFLEFSVTSWEGTHRNDFFYFLSFSAFQNLFWLEKFPKLWFLVFFNFFCYFLEFSITSWVGTHRNDFFFFFPLFLGHPQLILAWKEATMVFFNFFEFFCYFFLIFYYRLGRNSLERFFLFFFFFSFSAFSNLFWLGKMQQWCFLIFFEFFAIFFEFSITSRVGTHRNDFFFLFFFSLFLGLPEHIFDWKEATIVFFNFFFEFLAIFF